MRLSINIATGAHGEAKLRRPAVLAAAAALLAVVLINGTASINILLSA